MRLVSVQFEPQHLDMMQMREHEEKRLHRERVCAVANAGAAHTLIHEWPVEIVAVIGFFFVNNGTIEVYLIPSIYVPKYPVGVIRALKTHLRMLAQIPGIHRIQTSSWASPETDRWMEYLGFQCEGTLRQFTEDRLDYRIWAMLVGEGNGK